MPKYVISLDYYLRFAGNLLDCDEMIRFKLSIINREKEKKKKVNQNGYYDYTLNILAMYFIYR